MGAERFILSAWEGAGGGGGELEERVKGLALVKCLIQMCECNFFIFFSLERPLPNVTELWTEKGAAAKRFNPKS